VTDRDVLGKTVGELNLDERFGVAVTRVTRADLEMSAVPGCGCNWRPVANRRRRRTPSTKPRVPSATR
jgi:uncharacterized transporter YbjL